MTLLRHSTQFIAIFRNVKFTSNYIIILYLLSFPQILRNFDAIFCRNRFFEEPVMAKANKGKVTSALYILVNVYSKILNQFLSLALERVAYA